MGQSPSVLLDAVRGGGVSGDPRESIKKLLMQGISINYADEQGKTALHWAATAGPEELVSILLEFGASVEQKDFNECTPLFNAVFTGNLAAAKVLVEAGGADVNAVNKDGMTPLHWAVLECQYECVEYLVQKGADMAVKNKKGQTCRDLVQRLKPKKRSKMDDFLSQFEGKRPASASNTVEQVNGATPHAVSEKVLSQPQPAVETHLRLKRMLALCKLWGITKFMHPHLIRKNIDWDAALLVAIEEVNGATSSGEYRNAISKLLSTLQDPNTRCLGEEKKRRVQVAVDTQEQPYVTWHNDIAVLNATQHERFQDYQKMMSFMNCFKELSDGKAQAIVFDVRLKKGVALTTATYPFKFMFYEALRTILDREVFLPTYRQRVFTGFPQQRDFGNIFQSGVNTMEGEHITPNLIIENSVRAKWIFLINKSTPDPLVTLAVGLQTSGLAKVIEEREEGAPDTEIGISNFIINIGENITVSVRKNERINSDGSLGFHPDLQIEVAESETNDTAMQAALDVLRGQRDLRPPVKQMADVYVRRQLDDEFSDTQFPSKELRLLALFRFWNVIQYFFPYKSLLDRDWDEIFFQFLLKIEGNRNAIEYALTIAELTAATCDSHASCSSSVLNSYIGSHMPPLELRCIEGKTVITHFFAPLQKSGLTLGCEIVSIDKESVEDRKKRLAAILPASTPQALQLKVHQKLLAGEKESRVVVEVKTPAGQLTTVSLIRSILASTQRTSIKKPFNVLPEGFGFIDTVNLSNAEVERALEEVKDTPALILDIRGYPKGTIYHLAPRLTEKKVTVAVSQTPFFIPGSLFTELESSCILEELKVQPSSQWKYKGAVVALINSETISHAEHSCLYLEACTDVIFVGSSTNGANGNVTNCSLPGGILVGFTGLGIMHGDRTQLQRKGIQPHLEVHQTVQGIIQERDEVLEAAVAHLKGMFTAQ